MYYLIPRYLLAKRYWQYMVIIILLTILVVSIIHYPVMSYLFKNPFYITRQGYFVLLSDTIFMLVISTALKFLKLLYEREKYTKQLETQTLELTQKNLETELSLLKNQINPHFLFNTLNSIYFLIKKNPTQSREVVLQFSDMLSHQLYDATKYEIPISKEVEYIQNYIDLEKIRQGDLVAVDIEVSGDLIQPIAPMLILPFVENAFKHGKSKTDGYWIKILIQATEQYIKVQVENSFDPSAKPLNLEKDGLKIPHFDDHRKGIGLMNVRRRLELMYAQNYQLDVHQDQQIFKVNLTINHKQNKEPSTPQHYENQKPSSR
ncbi:hypothetical protein BKI52_29135 [marine bacterium AO1-C]|nr:hypothetical protein BKI52_29135 [marine bacterium AO1-C]